MSQSPRIEMRTLAPRPMAETRLILIPYAGAGVAAMRALAHSLPETIEPCGLLLPGREDLSRLPTFSRWPEMIEDAARAVGALPPVPVAIYGHSLGALIGLDLARRLQAEGSRPLRRLFVAARPAPSLAPPDREMIEEGSRLGGEEFMRRMSAVYGAPPASFENPEIRDYALPILKADLALLKDYAHPGPAGLKAPVTVMAGAEDPVTRASDLSQWAKETSGDFEIVEFNAGHYFLDAARADVAAAIAARLP